MKSIQPVLLSVLCSLHQLLMEFNHQPLKSSPINLTSVAALMENKRCRMEPTRRCALWSCAPAERRPRRAPERILGSRGLVGYPDKHSHGAAMAPLGVEHPFGTVMMFTGTGF